MADHGLYLCHMMSRIHVLGLFVSDQLSKNNIALFRSVEDITQMNTV